MMRFGLMALVLVVAGAAAAPSVDDLLKDRGLVHTGFLIVLPAEADLHTDARQLRGFKNKLANEAAARRDVDRAIKGAEEVLDQMTAQLAGIGDRQNASGLVQQISFQQARVAELKDQRQKLADSRADYVTLTLSLIDRSQAAMDSYHALTKDQDLITAIAHYNTTATLRLKLGPSGLFVDDYNFIKQCGGDVSTGIVAVDQSNGVPMVQAVVNGKVKHLMVWDSGASVVTLTSTTADELGLHPGARDAAINMKMADGRIVKAHLMRLDSIRVGPFTANDVDCVVMPKGAKGVGDLLGDTFQRHFLCRLDLASGELHLTPLDPQPAANKPRTTAAGAQTQP